MAGRYGGKHDLTFEQYHDVPAQWSAEGIVQQMQSLGGRYDLSYSGPRGYQVMWYRLSDGIRAHDAACIELAVRFIEDRFISSYSGFARTRMARALKQAQLSEDQKSRLSHHFLRLLETGDRTDEFSQYLRLWPTVISSRDRSRALELAEKLKSDAPEFHRRLVDTLTSNNSFEADREA